MAWDHPAKCLVMNISTYKFKRAFFRHDRRTAPKFGTHACADRDETGSHQKNLPTPPQRGLGGYLLMFVACGMWHVCGMIQAGGR